MSIDIGRARTAAENIKTATEHSGGRGALAGAAGVAGSVATAAALVGFGLTPVGWLTFATIGAVAGGTGAIKKIREKLS